MVFERAGRLIDRLRSGVFQAVLYVGEVRDGKCVLDRSQRNCSTPSARCAVESLKMNA